MNDMVDILEIEYYRYTHTHICLKYGSTLIIYAIAKKNYEL